MSLKTAKEVIDRIFDNIPQDMDEVEINFIGGEPLLEFELIKAIVSYTLNKIKTINFIFFATTNGTLLTDEMKSWFEKHKEIFHLGLSLDGMKKTHDHNRSNSFDSIDIAFFRKNWPLQGVKMTLSEYSIHYLADNIKYIHSLGFGVHGVNLFEGDFNWDRDEYIKILIPQLKELVRFYIENEKIMPDQMFDKHINYCESKNKQRDNWCGIGNGARFFDIDGKMYPCAFITPMTFSQDEILLSMKTDFADGNNFIDDFCFNNCYIYPICPTCAGENFMLNKTFKQRNKSKCRIQQLIVLFIADLQAKQILKNKSKLDDTTLYYTIEAIKKIRGLYLDKFRQYF
jgi:sulfatase maturation enzyme AslB (radical SAM superfamily)